ncbi:UNVERIFIED_CONTAM: hypothetical protein FKN15_033106 [Acipenser sinensis]
MVPDFAKTGGTRAQLPPPKRGVPHTVASIATASVATCPKEPAGEGKSGGAVAPVKRRRGSVVPCLCGVWAPPGHMPLRRPPFHGGLLSRGVATCAEEEEGEERPCPEASKRAGAISETAKLSAQRSNKEELPTQRPEKEKLPTQVPEREELLSCMTEKEELPSCVPKGEALLPSPRPQREELLSPLSEYPAPLPTTWQEGHCDAYLSVLKVSRWCPACVEWGHFVVNCPLPLEEEEPLPEGRWDSYLSDLEVSSGYPICGESGHFPVNCPLLQEKE